MAKATLQELKSDYYLDATSPSGLRWMRDVFAGRGYNILVASKDAVAGTLNKEGYWKSRRTFCHRIVFALANNLELDEFPHIDHIDQNSTNNLRDNLRPVSNKINNRNKCMRKDNKTGVTGVNLKTSGKRTYLAVTWRDNGKVRNRYFSVDDLGYDTALLLAKDSRARKMAELNLSGAGYTNRHGK